MKRNTCITIAFATLTAAALSSCSDSLYPEPETPDNPTQTDDEPRIEVVGGKPSSLAVASRAVSEPSQLGYCTADKLKIFVYHGTGNWGATTKKLEYYDLTYSDTYTTEAIDISNYSGENNCNKWTQKKINFALQANHPTGYGLPAIVYNSEDNNIFSISKGNNKFNNLSLQLSIQNNEPIKYLTPEFYFNHLTFKLPKNDGYNCKYSDYGVATQYSYSDYTHEDIPLSGKLYRIVSQLNLEISEIDPNEIEKMELYVSNLPISMTLFGNHGSFYPVTPAKDDSEHYYAYTTTSSPSAQDDSGSSTGDDGQGSSSGTTTIDKSVEPFNGVLIGKAEAADYSDGVAKFSTFLLPSHKGRSLSIRVFYKNGITIVNRDEDGNTILDKDGNPEITNKWYKDYDVKPATSIFLSGDDADVYLSYAAEEEKNGNDLYVYNQTENLFYSYSNVRVNIKGKFDNVFAETSLVDLDVEVCPYFERKHEFVINVDK